MSSAPTPGRASSLQPAKTAVLCLDTLGDLTLRQPLFSGLLDSGFEVTVVARRGYETLVPFLDRRLQALATDVDPFAPAGAQTAACLEALERRGLPLLLLALLGAGEVGGAEAEGVVVVRARGEGARDGGAAGDERERGRRGQEGADLHGVCCLSGGSAPPPRVLVEDPPSVWPLMVTRR